jgi:hypothetical protein
MKYVIVGNWSYAGTNKFVSHAVAQDRKKTLCGMDIAELMSRKGQQWEEDESAEFGCLKCRKKLAAEAMTAAKG